MGNYSAHRRLSTRCCTPISSTAPFYITYGEACECGHQGCSGFTYAYYQTNYSASTGSAVTDSQEACQEAINVMTGKNKFPVTRCLTRTVSLRHSSKDRDLLGKINVFVDKKTEVITLSFKDPDPEIAALMVQYIEEELETKVVDYRIRKAQKDCEYMAKLYEESKIEYEKAQANYADFVDHNRNITLERVQIERQRLRREDQENPLLTVGSAAALSGPSCSITHRCSPSSSLRLSRLFLHQSGVSSYWPFIPYLIPYLSWLGLS